MKKITPELVMKYVWELLYKYGKMAGKMSVEYGNYACRVVEASL